MTAYDRRLVEQLLPAVWDSHYAYGMENPIAPDPDMPRAPTDPAHAGTRYAHIADIKTGWQAAPLAHVDRRVLLLRYGLDWTEKHISRQLGIAQQTVSHRLAVGVGRIVEALNSGPACPNSTAVASPSRPLLGGPACDS